MEQSMQLVLAKLDCPACMPAAHTDIPQVRFADRGSQCNAQTVIWLRMDLAMNVQDLGETYRQLVAND